MDKMQLAHDWYMKHSKSSTFINMDVEMAWEYADAMQAEADKRKEKSLSDATNGCVTTYNIPETSITFTIDKVFTQEEWQPDWSQAPDWADWCTFDHIGQVFWEKQPSIQDDYWWKQPKDRSKFKRLDYNGNLNGWKDSLRKRPE